jgi:SAM-dependent methyltransferase
MKPKNYYWRYQHFLTLNLDKVESFRVIRNWLGNRKKIVDIGCGLGHLATFWQAIGLDNDPSAIQKAKSLFPQTKFILTDAANRLPFKDNSIDAFICYNILEHLTAWARKKLFWEIKRTLKKDGVLIAGYVDETFWFNRLLAFLMSNYGINDPTHLVSFTPEEFKNEIRKNFKIVKVKKTSQYGKLIFVTRFFKGEILIKAKQKK